MARDEKSVDLALKDLEKALQLDPKLVFAWRERVRILRAVKKDNARAIACLDCLLGLEPNDGLALRERGEAWLEVGNAQALTDLEAAVQSGLRGDAACWRSLALARELVRDKKGALEAFERYAEFVAYAKKELPAEDQKKLEQLRSAVR